MTIKEAAQKWHCTESVALKAVKSGDVKGAAKVRGRHGPEWNVPEDAPCPIASFNGIKTPGTLPTYTDTSDPEKFVRLNGNTKSIKYLAQVLGVSPIQIRSIYDRMLREGGVDFGAN